MKRVIRPIRGPLYLKRYRLRIYPNLITCQQYSGCWSGAQLVDTSRSCVSTLPGACQFSNLLAIIGHSAMLWRRATPRSCIHAARSNEKLLGLSQLMKVKICTLMTTIIVSVLGAALLVAAEMSTEEQMIRKSADNFAAAYNRGDATAVAAHWAKDGEYTIGQQTIKGRDAIAKLYATFLRAHPGSKMDITINSIRVLAPTVA